MNIEEYLMELNNGVQNLYSLFILLNVLLYIARPPQRHNFETDKII